jgi:hypothetical protein
MRAEFSRSEISELGVAALQSLLAIYGMAGGLDQPQTPHSILAHFCRAALNKVPRKTRVAALQWSP